VSLELEIVINDPFQASLIKPLFQTKEDIKLASPLFKFPFLEKEWEASFSRDPQNSSLLFKLNEQIIGHIAFLPSGEDLYMCYVIVLGEYRGQRLAKQMITLAEEFCRLNYPHQELYLNVEEKNLKAKNLYEKLGYETLAYELKKFKMKKQLRSY
jgi:ribosomal protein S18 acetylase RimI-like enzyme